MKLPYRLGDSFALPLGNRQFARSCIVQCEHRVVVIRAWIGENSWLDMRVSDDALVLHRWKRDGHLDVTKLAEPVPQNVYWMPAARAERIVAAATGAPHPRERKISVREVLDDNAANALGEVDDDCVLSFTRRVSPRTVDRAMATIHNHPGVTLRLSGDATSLIDVFASAPLTRLVLAGATKDIPPMPLLRHLELLGAHDVERVAAAAPNLESFRIASRDASVDTRKLATLPNLKTLDLSLVTVADARGFEALTQARALRMNRITGISTMEAIATLPLRTIGLAHLPALESVDDLSRTASIEQMELQGLWQFDISHLEWTLEQKALVRCEIDIGGRRKNLELYRRAHWAYPWRFPGTSSIS